MTVNGLAFSCYNNILISLWRAFKSKCSCHKIRKTPGDGKNTKVQEITAVVLGSPRQSDRSIYIHMFKMDYFRSHLDMVSQSNATPKFAPDFGTYSVYAYSYFWRWSFIFCPPIAWSREVQRKSEVTIRRGLYQATTHSFQTNLLLISSYHIGKSLPKFPT